MRFKHFSYAISIMLFLFCATNTYGGWVKTYGGSRNDSAYSVQQTDDNGYIVAGETNSFGFGDDLWILKLDINGVVQWEKTYGGITDDRAFSIQQTNDNGYIVAGYTRSFDDGTLWVLKLDSSGTAQWQKTYGEIFGNDVRSIQQTVDGGYIVAGYTRSFGGVGRDFLALKLDSSGVVQWQNMYGSVDFGRVCLIKQTNDGGYILVGETDPAVGGIFHYRYLQEDTGTG